MSWNIAPKVKMIWEKKTNKKFSCYLAFVLLVSMTKLSLSLYYVVGFCSNHSVFRLSPIFIGSLLLLKSVAREGLSLK